MKEPILLIMAAGMGSRYGGLKQMDPVGPSGEVILDYSLFDARRAGFRRVVFLIKKQIETDFRERVGRRIEPHMDVRYAFQELDKLPEPFAVPSGRVKPWGTGHAVLCCREALDAPFAVVNADDYYGPGAFQAAYNALSTLPDDSRRYAMIGYLLRNTLSDNGHVSRGVCEVDDRGRLLTVRERTHIIKTCDGPLCTEDGETYMRLSPDALVSMNMWCFTPTLLDALAAGFPPFLTRALREDPLRAEYFLPTVVSGMLDRGEATVDVLPCRDRWYGVTYPADKPAVAAALADMTDSGLYPSPLWPESGAM